MTKTTTVVERGNSGDHNYVIAEVDITSLDSAGLEPFDPSTEVGLRAAEGFVVDQEEPRRFFRYDPDNTQIDVLDRGPVVNQESVDPGSQTYSSGTETVLATYDPAPGGALDPLNFNPADPTDADLNVVLRAEFHDGTTTDLATVADGTEQSRENLLDGLATGDDGKVIRKLIVLVDETGGADATEDIGATTTEFYAYHADAANNDDVGTVTFKFVGDWST